MERKIAVYGICITDLLVVATQNCIAAPKITGIKSNRW